MKIRWLTAVAICLAAAQAKPECDDSCELEKIRKSAALPALGAAINRNGQFTSAVTGFRKLWADVPVTQDDMFHLGSLTKAMTATLIALLVDQGRLSWDTTIPEALPNLGVDIASGHLKTTIAMLGSHRSGIVDDIASERELWEELHNPSLPPVEGRKLMIERILSREPEKTPLEFSYDNTNYVILGTVVENFMDGHVPWEDNIKEHLFEPLGMNCGFGIPPQSSETSIDNPWGHQALSVIIPPVPRGGPLNERDNPPAFGPAGTVHCDMKSYTEFTRLHLEASLGQSTALNISQETFRYLHTPYPATPDSPQPYTPGGWLVYDGSSESWPNGSYLMHTGTNTMNYAETVIAPGLGETRTMFTNVGNTQSGESTAPAGDAAKVTFNAINDGRLFNPDESSDKHKDENRGDE